MYKHKALSEWGQRGVSEGVSEVGGEHLWREVSLSLMKVNRKYRRIIWFTIDKKLFCICSWEHLYCFTFYLLQRSFQIFRPSISSGQIMLPTVSSARFIRFHPVTYNQKFYPCLKVEIFGCGWPVPLSCFGHFWILWYHIISWLLCTYLTCQSFK